ncbi:MAG: outer membrane beta-barrel protein [Thermoanaerobaculales bacterium]|nr:outer membrane beta-barrel protein [Thermoanaerobaculales bacterium]
MRILKRMLIFLVIASCLPVVVNAQGFPSASRRSAGSQGISPQGNDPIVVGPFLFSPALQLSWENHSNLWQSATEPVKDDIYVARLRLLFEVPVRESFIRISYTPQYRESKNRNLHNSWDHYLEVSGDFEFSNGLTMGAAYRLVDGDVATDEVDPGGELILSGRRFSKHSFLLDADYWFTARDGLAFGYTAAKVEWRGDPVIEGFSWYDYDQSSLRLGWLHQVNPTLVMDVSYSYGEYEPDNITDQIREYSSQDVTVGFRGQLGESLSTEIRAGYMQTDFANASENVPGFDDFSGIMVKGNVIWALAHGSKFRLDLVRQPFASNYDLNSYYTGTAARLLFDLDMGRLFGQARARFQTNEYQIPDSLLGELRTDDLMILGVGLGFRINDRFSLRGSYIYEDRDSLEPYTYLNKVWLLDLIFGY